MEPVYAFFVRNNNDIDHIVPVAWRLAREGAAVRVVITTHPGYKRDPRMVFLCTEGDVEVSHILDFMEGGPTARMRVMREVLGDAEPNAVNFADAWAPMLQDDAFFDGLIAKLFGSDPRGVVCFDWTATPFVAAFLDRVRRAGLPSVSLPHGLKVFTNSLVSRGCLNFEVLHKGARDMAIFDYMVVPNRFMEGQYLPVFSRERVKTLGSPRYCRQWREVMPSIEYPPFTAGEGARLKVAFFLRDQGYDIFWEEVLNVYKLLLQFPDLHLAVKHHPRTVGQAMLKRAHPELFTFRAPNLTILNDQGDSMPVVEWADIIVDGGTSITIEGLLEDKPVLSLEYLHPNRTTIAEHIPNCDIQTRDQLYLWVERFLGGYAEEFYGKEREELVSVWIENYEPDVLGAYASFLRSIA